MEFDDLKRSWELYDKKLSESLKLNEELLRRSNLDRSKSEITPVYYTILGGAVIVFLFLFFLFGATISHVSQLKFLVSGIVSIFFFLLLFLLALLELKELSRLDHYNMSVVELQKGLAKFSKWYAMERKWAMCLFPLLFAAAFPITAISIKNWDILADPIRYIVYVLGASLLCYVFSIKLYRNFERKIKMAHQFLSELKEFEAE